MNILKCFLKSYCKSRDPSQIVVMTTYNGYDPKYFIDETNATKLVLSFIDMKYGMQSRFESTSIKDMIEGAKEEGYIFNVIKERADKVDIEALEKINKLYICNSGNY